MLAELLSQPPASFVFREPRLPLGRLRLKPETADVLSATSLDVESLSSEMSALDPEAAIHRFRTVVVESSPLDVVGVKEIRHEGVETVSRVFPDMRVVATLRDPRDIYLSMYHKRDRLRQRNVSWSDPHALAEDLQTEFAHITDLLGHHEHLVVRYEDLVNDPAVIHDVRTFAGVRIEGNGLLGRSSPFNRQRHGHEVGTSRSGVWTREPEGEGLENARIFQSLVPEYEALHASLGKPDRDRT